MTTSYPTGLDTLRRPSASETLATAGHASLHDDLADAIEALEAKVGVDNSIITTSFDYRIRRLEVLFGPSMIFPIASSTAPAGSVLCQNQELSRTTYAALWAKLTGLGWGNGNGSTTFNAPDLRGRSLFGLDGGTGRTGLASALGAAGGHQNLQSHGHTASSTNEGSHIHGLPTTAVASGLGVTVVSPGGAGSTFTAAGTAHNHPITVNANGGGNAENMPPMATVNWCIVY